MGDTSASSPNSHSLFYVSWGQVLVKVNHKLCELLHMDHVFWVVRTGVNDLCATSHLREGQRQFILPFKALTCNGSSVCSACLSAARSHNAGTAKPVSDSLTPASSLTFFTQALISSSTVFIKCVYGPAPYKSMESYIFSGSNEDHLALHMISGFECRFHRELEARR